LVKKYDHIVVGSGASGLTLASLLALNGRQVLLVEKAGSIGGSLVRFYKEGIPFDTGFHFTGGFSSGGILVDMLHVLGFKERIRPIFLSGPGSSVFSFEEDGLNYDMPCGTDKFRLALHKYFPDEKSAIDTYFALIKKVWQSTLSLELRKITLSAKPIEEDFVSLQSVLDSLTSNHKLKGLLSVFCLCYGTKPQEVSFANHARVAGGLYESVARIEHGGEAIIKAFRDLFSKIPIDIKCDTEIVECGQVKDNCVGEFFLNSGERILAGDCTFTIHPQEVLKVLPSQYLKKAFIERVSSFEASCGFFSTFGVVENADPLTFGPSIVSLLPSYDLNALLDPGYRGAGALAVIRSSEVTGGKNNCVINAFEPEFFSSVKRWEKSSVGKRPTAYYEQKKHKIDKIKERICNLYPQYRGKLKILDAASVLTFRDYLSSPEGNAYGIKQKV
jgi:phytoene dehydrogenase-like protein